MPFRKSADWNITDRPPKLKTNAPNADFTATGAVLTESSFIPQVISKIPEKRALLSIKPRGVKREIHFAKNSVIPVRERISVITEKRIIYPPTFTMASQEFSTAEDFLFSTQQKDIENRSFGENKILPDIIPQRVFDRKDDTRIIYPTKGILTISQANVPIINIGPALQQKKRSFCTSAEDICLLKYKSDVIFAPRG